MTTTEHAVTNQPKFTPTEARILKVLADGLNHHPDELWAVMDDPLSESESLLRKHICLLRVKLKTIDQDIVAVFNHKRTYWRRVRIYYGADE